MSGKRYPSPQKKKKLLHASHKKVIIQARSLTRDVINDPIEIINAFNNHFANYNIISWENTESCWLLG